MPNYNTIIISCLTKLISCLLETGTSTQLAGDSTEKANLNSAKNDESTRSFNSLLERNDKITNFGKRAIRNDETKNLPANSRSSESLAQRVSMLKNKFFQRDQPSKLINNKIDDLSLPKQTNFH